jgi:hypothetical protein
MNEAEASVYFAGAKCGLPRRSAPRNDEGKANTTELQES